MTGGGVSVHLMVASNFLLSTCPAERVISDLLPVPSLSHEPLMGGHGQEPVSQCELPLTHHPTLGPQHLSICSWFLLTHMDSRHPFILCSAHMRQSCHDCKLSFLMSSRIYGFAVCRAFFLVRLQGALLVFYIPGRSGNSCLDY